MHGWSQPAQRCVWSFRTVFDLPSFDDLGCLSEGAEDVFVQVFVPQSAIEAFQERVLNRFAGGDLMQADATALRPLEDSVRFHFCSVVTDNHVWLAASSDQIIQFAGHSRTGQRAIHHSCQNFTCAIAYHAQHLEPLGIRESVGRKVERSSLVGAIWHQNWSAYPQSPFT